MGIKNEVTEGFIERFLTGRAAGYMEEFYSKLEDWKPTNRVILKRMLPQKQKFLDRLIDMQVFFTEITGREPTKVLMGWKQQRELQSELRSLHMVMMPHKGWVGILCGMKVFFVLEDSKLEVTC